MMKTLDLLIAALLLLLLAFESGCANMFSAKTIATYEITSDGKMIRYESSKEQQGLDLDLTEDNGQVKVVRIHVDRASTAEAAMAAALQVQLQILKILETLAPLAAQAVKSGS